MSPGRLRVGTSGYHYAHWRNVLYPVGMSPARWLEHYAETFETVEINNTFYRLPERSTFVAWRRAVPPGFCFALKFSRYGTHVKRLREPRPVITAFLERARALGPLLGPILVQLPPQWPADPDRLEGFLAALPGGARFAVEFRDPSWLCESVTTLLRQHGAAFCVHDGLEHHPVVQTADWVYLRFHGPRSGGPYTPQRLAAWARRIRAWLRAGVDVYAYFNNDAEGHAVRNALQLRRYVGRRLGRDA